MFRGRARGLLISGIVVTCLAVGGGSAGLGLAADRGRVTPTEPAATGALAISDTGELTAWDEVTALESVPEVLLDEPVTADPDDGGPPSQPGQPNKPPKPNKPPGQGRGSGAAGQRGHPAVVPGTGFGPGQIVHAAAEVIGIPHQDLRRALNDGSSLGAVAQQRGPGRDALIRGLTDRASVRLRDRVAAGEISQAEADQAQAAINSRLPEIVDATWPGRGRAQANRPGQAGHPGRGPQGQPPGR
jgi:hypothetical protein